MCAVKSCCHPTMVMTNKISNDHKGEKRKELNIACLIASSSEKCSKHTLCPSFSQMD